MPDRESEARIDSLYQLPLDEFTSARNALAKELGKEGAGVQTLTKPPAAAWAINQVFWQRRPIHDALVAAATGVRSAHAAVMAGQRADLRAAGAAHDEAIEAALRAALDVLASAGQPASDATKQAIATTLRALPTAAEPAGRLSRTLQPGGFEMLAGLPAGGTAVAFPPRAKPGSAAGGESAGKTTSHAAGQAKKRGEVETREEAAARRKQEAERNKAIASAREAAAAAAKAERAAEQEARRAEFDAAKSARDVERAQAQRDAAQAALEAAQTAADEAEAELTEATRKRDGDARRGREHAAALAKARVKLEAAQAELARLTE